MTKKAKNRRGNPKIAEAGARTRFKPGVSPNPGGRPKCASFSEAIRLVSGLTVKELRNSASDPVAVAVAKALTRQALKGKVSAISEVIDRSEGKARQALDMNHQGPVRIELAYEDPLMEPKDSSPEPSTTPASEPAKQAATLFEMLLELVKTTPEEDEQTLKAAAALALLLKEKNKKGKSDERKKEIPA